MPKKFKDRIDIDSSTSDSSFNSKANLIKEEINPEEETTPEITTKEEITEPQKEEPIVKSDVPEVKYREVVYLGIANEAERIGAVTRNQYIFRKDNYDMPEATQVDEKDYPALIAERGRGCSRRDPQILFMSKLEWDLELEQARIANSS